MGLKLREWQAQAIDSAELKYAEGQSHFLCLATPGAGKTVMASILAQRLLAAKKIDLILCFSPSVNIASAFRDTLEKQLQEPMDGSLGAKGQSMTINLCCISISPIGSYSTNIEFLSSLMRYIIAQVVIWVIYGGKI